MKKLKRHQFVVNLPLTLLLFLIKERALSKFISNAVDFFLEKEKDLF